jgi:hypothetical protein
MTIRGELTNGDPHHTYDMFFAIYDHNGHLAATLDNFTARNVAVGHTAGGDQLMRDIYLANGTRGALPIGEYAICLFAQQHAPGLIPVPPNKPALAAAIAAGNAMAERRIAIRLPTGLLPPLEAVITQPPQPAPDPAAVRAEGNNAQMPIRGEVRVVGGAVWPLAGGFDMFFGIYDPNDNIVAVLNSEQNVALNTEATGGDIDFTQLPKINGRTEQLEPGEYYIHLIVRRHNPTPIVPLARVNHLPPYVVAHVRKKIEITAAQGLEGCPIPRVTRLPVAESGSAMIGSVLLKGRDKDKITMAKIERSRRKLEASIRHINSYDALRNRAWHIRVNARTRAFGFPRGWPLDKGDVLKKDPYDGMNVFEIYDLWMKMYHFLARPRDLYVGDSYWVWNEKTIIDVANSTIRSRMHRDRNNFRKKYLPETNQGRQSFKSFLAIVDGTELMEGYKIIAPTSAPKQDRLNRRWLLFYSYLPLGIHRFNILKNMICGRAPEEEPAEVITAQQALAGDREERKKRIRTRKVRRMIEENIVQRILRKIPDNQRDVIWSFTINQFKAFREIMKVIESKLMVLENENRHVYNAVKNDPVFRDRYVHLRGILVEKGREFHSGRGNVAPYQGTTYSQLRQFIILANSRLDTELRPILNIP